MPQKILIKRGLKNNLPLLSQGEPALCTDTKEVFVGNGTSNIELIDKVKLSKVRNYMKGLSPLKFYYGKGVSKDIDNNGGYEKCGEPFIVWDEVTQQYVMFYFGLSSGGLTCLRATSKDLITNKVWNKAGVNISATNLTGRHKLAVLVDEYGEPAKLNGKYHGYVVSASPNKNIYHWEATSLTGSWTETGIVIAKNFAGNGSDDSAADAPYALYYDGQIYMYYMGHPYSNAGSFGYAMRINLAKSSSPSSGFTFVKEFISPSNDNTKWYYGWIGGMQIQKHDDFWWICFNAGKNRPLAAENEVDPSAWGFAIATAPDGIVTIKNTPYQHIHPYNLKDYLDRDIQILPPNLNIDSVWRPHLEFDREHGKWVAFYNSGPLVGTEWITHAVTNSYDIRIESVNQLQYHTGTYKAIKGTLIKHLPMGTYNVKYSFKTAFTDGTTGSKDISYKMVYGVKELDESEIFAGTNAIENIANYPYMIDQIEFGGFAPWHNANTIIEHRVNVEKENGYVFLMTKINDNVDGKPHIKNLRVYLEKID